MPDKNATPGKDGNLYVPYDKRTGEKSVVYFTRDLSPEGLKKIYDRVSKGIEGKVAIKLHTGEAEGHLTSFRVLGLRSCTQTGCLRQPL